MKKQTKKIKTKVMPEKTQHISPADVFMHLLATIMLYASAISFLVVIFQLVNVNLPDILDQNTFNYYYLDGAYSLMRGAIAFLIISFPVYIFCFWRLKKSYEKNPQKLELRIRKWLVYFTLFSTALLIVGNLIALLIGFLHGDFTLRFVLKILSVFFVAGSIFTYYIFDLKNRYKIALRILFIFITIAVLGTIITGFFFIGSPSEQRLRKLDNQKIQSIENIRAVLDQYYLTNKKLPQDLTELNSLKYNGANFVDQQTQKNFGYKAIDDTNYQLCATFNLSNYSWDYRKKYNRTVQSSDYSHPSGDYCYDLTASSYNEKMAP